MYKAYYNHKFPWGRHWLSYHGGQNWPQSPLRNYLATQGHLRPSICHQTDYSIIGGQTSLCVLGMQAWKGLPWLYDWSNHESSAPSPQNQAEWGVSSGCWMVVAISAYLEWGQPFIQVSLAHQYGVPTFHRCQQCMLQLLLLGHWCQGKFPESHFWDGLMSINCRELYGITMALAILGDYFRGKRILVHCDNAPVVQIMNKCSSKSKSMMVLVCSLVLFSMQNNFDLYLQCIPLINNGIDGCPL